MENFRSKQIMLMLILSVSLFIQAYAQPDIKLHVEGSAQFDKVGPALGRLILNTVSPGDPGRYGIQFSNNTLAPFLGDDIDDQQYDFYSAWHHTRTYDAVINIHGKSTSDWGRVLTLTHDGDDGRISTDQGNLLLDPQAGFVGIGTDAPLANLHVEGNGIVNGTTQGLTVAANSRNNITNNSYAIQSSVTFDDNQAIKKAANLNVSGDGLLHYGLDATVSGSSTITGVRGHVLGSSALNSYGVYGDSEGTATNKYGVYGVARGNGGTKYGIYGTVSGTGTSYAGYFDGDVFSTGSYLPSDRTLKTDIRSATSSLDRIQQLRVKSYHYDKHLMEVINLDDREQTGLIAQEVKEIFPELIKEVRHSTLSPDEIMTGSTEQHIDFMSVNYIGLIPHLIKSIQEQQIQIDHLQAVNDRLTTSYEMLLDMQDLTMLTKISNAELHKQ